MKKFYLIALMILSVSLNLEAAPKDSKYWNDLARYFAGMPIREESPLKPATKHQYYIDHIDYMNKFWEKVSKETVGIVSEWSKDNIPQSILKNPAFYPFSGADLVNLYTMFPKAPYYIMMALEDPGHIPDPMSLKEYELKYGFTAFKNAIETIASMNYFHSQKMYDHMSNKYFTGTLPTLLAFAARLNLSIVDIEQVGLDQKGNVQKMDDKGLIDGIKPKITGNRIAFKGENDYSPRTLLYLKMRLSNKVIDEQTPEGKFFNRLPNFNFMTKSAVYFLHRKGFEDLCAYYLKKSDIIIQDDSGIPYKYFVNDNWDRNLFGVYTTPAKIKDLADTPHQPELTAAYKVKSTPLPFRYGYGVLRAKNNSNLMMMIKKKK